MSRNVTAVVLCEDKQSRTVLYRYLKHERGFPRVRGLPASWDHVREPEGAWEPAEEPGP